MFLFLGFNLGDLNPAWVTAIFGILSFVYKELREYRKEKKQREEAEKKAQNPTININVTYNFFGDVNIITKEQNTQEQEQKEK